MGSGCPLTRLLLALLLALPTGCVAQPRYPVARVLFTGHRGVTHSGTAVWIGKDYLLTVPHVAVGDRCRAFPGRSGRRWIWSTVIARTPTYALIRPEAGQDYSGFADGDSGSPVLDPKGLLIGLIEAGLK